MKVTRITLGKTVNLGNFQSIKAEVTVEQETGAESTADLTFRAIEELKDVILAARNEIGK